MQITNLSIEIFRYKTMRRMFYFQWKGGREQYFKIEIVELYQSNGSKFVFYAQQYFVILVKIHTKRARKTANGNFINPLNYYLICMQYSQFTLAELLEMSLVKLTKHQLKYHMFLTYR